MDLTYRQMATDLGIPFCGGECGITIRSHDNGFLFFNVIHFTERRFTRRGAKRFLLVAAWRERQLDPEFLNDPRFDWMYPYIDSVRAQAMARQFGFRIPADLFDHEREMTLLLARKRKVRMSRHPAIASWLKR